MEEPQLVVTSKVARASSKSPSVRTTIPEEIAKQLKVGVSDVLVWEQAVVKGKAGAFIRKAE